MTYVGEPTEFHNKCFATPEEAAFRSDLSAASSKRLSVEGDRLYLPLYLAGLL